MNKSSRGSPGRVLRKIRGRIKGFSESIQGKLPRRIPARIPEEIPRGIPADITIRISGGDLGGIADTLEAAGIAFGSPGDLLGILAEEILI